VNQTPAATGFDYRQVTSVEAAEALVRQGRLVRLLLLPVDFGGADVPHNSVYVPPFVVELKDSIDRDIILPLAQEGRITQYAAQPEYAGESFVPVALHVTAWEPGSFNTVIRIWGAA
jgi:hypothetical protein